jgi:hypothetical protein
MSAWEFKTRNPSKNQMVGPLVRIETVVLLLCYIVVAHILCQSMFSRKSIAPTHPRHFQQYFSYIVAVSFIGRENRSTQRKETVVLLLCYIDNTDSIFFIDYNIFVLLSFNFIFCNASMIPIICKKNYPFVLGVYGNHIPSDEY